MIHNLTLYGSAFLIVVLFTGVIYTFTGYEK